MKAKEPNLHEVLGLASLKGRQSPNLITDFIMIKISNLR